MTPERWVEVPGSSVMRKETFEMPDHQSLQGCYEKADRCQARIHKRIDNAEERLDKAEEEFRAGMKEVREGLTKALTGVTRVESYLEGVKSGRDTSTLPAVAGEKRSRLLDLFGLKEMSFALAVIAVVILALGVVFRGGALQGGRSQDRSGGGEGEERGDAVNFYRVTAWEDR